MDECLENNGGCHDKRKCTNTPGSMTCGDCPDGLINAGAKDCTGVFACARLCVLGVGMRHVVSADIYMCGAVDVDECIANNGGCDSKRECINIVGGHECGECAVGWSKDGATGCKGS